MVEEAGPHTPLFSLEGRTLQVKVIDAYDADTVTVALTLGEELCAFKVRLTGIDTPEMRPPRAQIPASVPPPPAVSRPSRRSTSSSGPRPAGAGTRRRW